MQIPQDPTVDVDKAHLAFNQVQLPYGLVFDEVSLDFVGIHAKGPGLNGEQPAVDVNETHFRVMMTEPHINLLLKENADKIPAKDVSVVVLTGKLRVHGTYVKSILRLPFVVECVPRIENGVKIDSDFKDAQMGVSMPSFIVDAISQHLMAIDLNRLPVPVFLESIECEPGRVTVSGRARISWPLITAVTAAPPFTQKALS